MRTLPRHRRLAPLAIAAPLLTAFLLLVAWASPAAAHDALIDSSPAADSTVDALPSELTLTFSAALITGEGTTAVVVTDADGAVASVGEATVNGAIVTQELSGSGAPGQYHVAWRVVSSDGHDTDGQYCFSVGGDADDAVSTPAPCADQVASLDSGTSASGWIWAISIIAILLVAGIAVLVVVRGRRTSPDADSGTPSER